MNAAADPEFVALQEAVRAGKQDAATALYHRFGPRVRAHFSKLLDAQPSEVRILYDSEALMHDALMEFYEHILKNKIFGHPEQVEAYLSKLSHSHFIDTLRRLRRQRCGGLLRRLRLDDPALDNHPRLVSHEPSPSERAQTKELLRELLTHLPKPHQRVVTLRVEGFAFPEIARKLGMSERWVCRVLQAVREAGSAPTN